MFGHSIITDRYHQMMLDRITELEKLNNALIGRLLESKGLPAPIISPIDKRTPEELVKDLADIDGVDLFEDEDDKPRSSEQVRAEAEDREHEDDLVETQP